MALYHRINSSEQRLILSIIAANYCTSLLLTLA